MSRNAPKIQTHPLYALAKAKWESSGISEEQAEKLKFLPLTAEEAAALSPNFKAAGALKLPYFDLKGNLTDFYRIRYLEKLPGFAGQAVKPQRYAQPKGTLNEVYLPPLLPTPWEAVAADPNVPIYITEGELKAAAGAGAGLAVIGLGGVDVWRSSKRGLELLPVLQKIKWQGRAVTIIYDSDAATNPNVVRAQRQLAQELLSNGAFPNVAALPAAKDGSKQGLDDYLLAFGAKALEKVIRDAPAFPEAAALWELSEEVVFVRDPGMVIERRTGQRMDPTKFSTHIYGNRHYIETTVTPKGGVQIKKKPLAKRWLEWESRFEVDKVTYAPGQPQLHEGTWNNWQGWGVEPKKGDIAPWKWLLDYLFKSDQAARKWFEQWCAYPIQKPGSKMYTSTLLWGPGKGTGKTLVAYSLMAIYGRNAIEIKSKDLKGGFNSWAENRQFVYGDEITGGQARVDADWLKGLITQPWVRINPKYVPEYVVPDCMNYLFTSNHPDAIFLEDGDRRFFVWEVVGGAADRSFYDQYDKWLNGDMPNSRQGPGPAALMHHLLNLDLTGFNPREHAPVTAGKQAMITAGKSDVGLWVESLKTDPCTALKPMGEKTSKDCDLFTPTQLLHCYDPDGSKRVTAGGVGRELSKLSIRQVNAGSPVRTDSLGVVRLYAVRNAEKWAQASPKLIKEHFDKFFGEGGGRKF